MQIKRRIVVIFLIFFTRKLIRENCFHLNEMQDISRLCDDVEFASLTGDIAVADGKTVPLQVFGSHSLTQGPDLLASLRGYVHGF